MKDFKDKIVVITGGSTGIGKAMAGRFGAKGAKVIIAARRVERLQEVVADLTARGVEARCKVCDVSDLDDMQALADFAWEQFGQVDLLVNNAGITGAPVAVVDATPEAYRHVFEVNIFGMLNGIWAFGNRMIAQGTPAMILNVSSETGLYVPGPMMGGYAASKHAARAISEALRFELPEHLQVGVIYPGMVQSELGGSPEMTSMGMPTNDFVDIIWPQIENGEFHIVSHPWARDYAAKSAAEIDRAFDRYAPHFEGDRKYDSRWLANQASGRF